MRRGTLREPELPSQLTNKAPLPGVTQPKPVAPVARAPMPAPFSTFKGLDFQHWGAGWPPDTDGDVGPTYYVQVVNTSVGIFNKSSGSRVAAFTFDGLWSTANSGTACDTSNYGDPTVVWDPSSDRWIVADFAFDGSGDQPPFYECIAVSRTNDPVAGGWYLYAVRTDDSSHPWFADYPKMGIWPDGLYMTTNEFGFDGFREVRTWAFNRSDLEAGVPVRTKVVDLNSGAYASLLPSNMRSVAGAPPAGRSNLLIGESLTAFAFNVFKFHVDWVGSGTTFTGPTNVSQASYTSTPDTIPTPFNPLDSLGDRLMMQAQYSNIGGTESLWVNHTISCCGVNSPAGIQWTQVGVTGGTVATTPIQQQRFPGASDTLNRWMGSLAVDRNGDMALGYSLANQSTNPDIRYTGRLATDPLSTLPQTETTMLAGVTRGTQSGSCGGGTCFRWGDYSSMSIDPNGCTFWYTQEYYESADLNWQTRIGSFKFPSCSTGPADFIIAAAPNSLGVMQGGSGKSNVSATLTNGADQAVALAASGQPTGMTIGFSPTSISTGGSSQMTADVDAGVAPGTYTVTVTGTGTTGTHTADVTITVVPPGLVNGGFETGTLDGWTTGGAFAPLISSVAHTGDSSAQLGSHRGADGDSTLTQAVAIPASGMSQLSFWYQPHCADDRIQVHIQSVSGDTLFSAPDICDSSSTWTQKVIDTTPWAGQAVVLWFNAHDDGFPEDPTYFFLDDVTVGLTPPDFFLSAAPDSLAVKQGAGATTSIASGVTNGPAQAVDLSATGQPTGVTVGFNPASVLTGVTSLMSIDVAANVTPGTYPVTVTGSNATATHETTVTLFVASAGVTNGGFESGLDGWTASGDFGPVPSNVAHGGGSSAQIGSHDAVSGNSTLTQAVAVPSGSSQLTFWYQPHCLDEVSYDQIQMQIRSLSGQTLATPLPDTCANSPTWTKKVFDTSSFAGQIVVLWFNDHDDGYLGDPTYFLLDDVSVAAAAPTITSFSPSSGPVDTLVTIKGSGFIGSSVTIGGAFAPSPQIDSPTQIRARVPLGALTGKIRVSNGGGTATSGSTFKVTPKITSFAPATVQAGDIVDVYGTNLDDIGAQLKLGSAIVTAIPDSSMHESFVVTSGMTTGKLLVATPSGSYTTPTSLGVRPTVAGFVPLAGAAGSSVTVSGLTFVGVSSVRFTGVGATAVSASYSVVNSTTLKATVPAAAVSGPIRVGNAGGSTDSGTSFAVIPKIASFAPSAGPTGSSVTITGGGFGGDSAVEIGGREVIAATVVSSAQIKAIVPDGATTGQKIEVKTTGGTQSAESAAPFTITFGITGFEPASGEIGTLVTISGPGISAATGVSFNGHPATIESKAPTLLVRVPADATSGRIAATGPAGTVQSADDFTVTTSMPDPDGGSPAPNPFSLPRLLAAGAGFSWLETA